MDIIQTKMKKWLKGFGIFFQVCAWFIGIGIGGCAVGCLTFAINKNIFNYQLSETTTVGDLFSELNYSRLEIVWYLISIIVYLSILLALLILLTKWFKSTSLSGEPFSENSIKLMAKISKYAIISSIIGFVFENILFMFIDISMSYGYESIFIAGLLIKCLSYVFAYASFGKKENLTDNENNDIANLDTEKTE